MRSLTCLSFVVAVALAGCKKDEPAPVDPAPASPPPAAEKPTEKPDQPAEEPGDKSKADRSSADRSRADKALAAATTADAAPAPAPPSPATLAARCPSEVAGARTQITPVAGGFEVVITGEPVDQIRKRAQQLVESPEVPASAAESGSCPVILDNTVVTYAEAEGGAKMTIRPKRKEDLAGLLAEARRRAAAPQAR